MLALLRVHLKLFNKITTYYTLLDAPFAWFQLPFSLLSVKGVASQAWQFDSALCLIVFKWEQEAINIFYVAIPMGSILSFICSKRISPYLKWCVGIFFRFIFSQQVFLGRPFGSFGIFRLLRRSNSGWNGLRLKLKGLGLEKSSQ